MAAKDCFWLFDYYSQFLGISIFVHERRKSLVYFNYFRKSVQIILSFLSVVYSFLNMFHSSTPLYELNVLTFYVGQIILNMLMHIQGKNICRHFNDVLTRIQESQKRRMYIVSSCLTSVVIFIHIWIVVLHVILESNMGYSWDYITFVSYQVNGDPYFHSLVWVSLLILSSYYDYQNCLNNIDRRLKSGTERDATLSEFILCRAEMMKQSVSAVNIFSGLPLLVTIGFIFIGFSGVLSLARSNVNEILLLRVSECVFIALYCLAMIALLVMVTVLRHKLESLKSALIFRLSHENHENLTINWKIGLKTLYDQKLFEFSVVDLFPLDLNLILQFAAFLITFTVLLLQIESSVS